MIRQQENNRANPSRQLASQNTSQERHGSPRAGMSLTVATEIRGAQVREAVKAVLKGSFGHTIHADSTAMLSTSITVPLTSATPDSSLVRAAWNLILILLTARKSGELSASCGFYEAESWFAGSFGNVNSRFSSQFSAKCLCDAEELLDNIIFDREFTDLLPYILEGYGPANRMSVMKDPTTANARAAKRQKGVFYTPSDVASYMVKHIRQNYKGDLLSAKVMDPACGTGVFLLAMLRIATQQGGKEFSLFEYITSCLHGFDISGQALDAAAFLLLGECLSEIRAEGVSPLVAWQSIRRNLIEIDSISVESVRTDSERFLPDLFINPHSKLRDLFPEASDGFDILVGNPPYAAMGERGDYDLLAGRFVSLTGLKRNPKATLVPLFVEMMWQLTKPGCNAAALVTPLSVAFHSGVQYEACRHAMSWNGGRWQFAFFDREPHALFGEEVKTRNAILFRFENIKTPKRGQSAIIETGPLRRWTSRTRASLFESIHFTPLNSIEITKGIPKIDGKAQAEAFMTLKQRNNRLRRFAVHIGTCALTEALNDDGSPKVFVGGTAYNFLNVYRPIPIGLYEKSCPLSDSPVHCLQFKTEAEASAAFAILSSRLVFWMWHVLGDGFHVTSALFNMIPFNRDSFSQAEIDSLVHLGDILWDKLQTQGFISVNGGRQTVGFRPYALERERSNIDAILIKVAGLQDHFAVDLRTFVHDNAVVDSTDERRNHVTRQFNENLTQW